jgi:uncharacterized protein YggE
MVLALGLAAAAGAQSPAAGASPRTLTVTGEGEAAGAPDLAVVTLAVETEGATAAEAAASNAERADTVKRRLEELSSLQTRVSTSGYSLDPVYAPAPPSRDDVEQPPVIRGYRAYNEVRVEVRELSGVGRVLDAAIAAGANRVNAVTFNLEARETALREALTRAGREARAQAEAAAAALGVRLGAVVSAHAGSGPPPPVPMPMFRQMEAASVATPIEPGEVAVRATLTVSYEIE